MSRTIIRFTREGLEGRVSGYNEVTVPAQSITAKNSTSLLRKPAAKADMVRGKAGFFPFSPGGLDIGKASETAEELEQAETAFAERLGADGLLQVPPGFTRGLMLPKEETEELVEEQDDFNFGDVKPIRKSKFMEVPTKKPDGPLSELDSIDDLLPVEVRTCCWVLWGTLLTICQVPYVGSSWRVGHIFKESAYQRVGSHGRY